MQVLVLSPTQQEFDGVKYYLCGEYFQTKGKRLHVAVWKYNNGQIPKGYHVHHKDGNKANNNIDNLQLLPGNMHRSLHGRSAEKAEYNRKHIKDMQDLAAEWHRSAEGRKWHGEHAKEMWKTKEDQLYRCSQCGELFYTKHNYGDNQNTFCSNNCKAAHRRALAVDKETRECVYCKRSYVTNRYSKAQCCSRECAVKKRWNK